MKVALGRSAWQQRGMLPVYTEGQPRLLSADSREIQARKQANRLLLEKSTLYLAPLVCTSASARDSPPAR